MKCACTLGSRAPATFSESVELSCACPSFCREKFTEPTRYDMCPWGRLIHGYHTRFFLQRDCCCHVKEVVPVDHIMGMGLSSNLTSGSKIRLTAGFEPCPQGPAVSSFSCSTLSLIMCTLLWAFNTYVSCITLFRGLAASHSSKDPPSLAY